MYIHISFHGMFMSNLMNGHSTGSACTLFKVCCYLRAVGEHLYKLFVCIDKYCHTDGQFWDYLSPRIPQHG